jgi:dolichol kinase
MGGERRPNISSKPLRKSAFLFSALLIIWIYPGLNRLAGSLAALGATFIELLPIPIDDNVTIPLVAGAIMFFAGG